MTGLRLLTVPTARGWRWQVCVNGRCLATGVAGTRDLALATLKRWAREYV